MQPKSIIVFNPKSGKGKAAARVMEFSQSWEKTFGTRPILRATVSLADIRIAAKEAAELSEKEGTIPIFTGGDGTLSESLQGLAEYYHFSKIPIPVGFLPGGTGNSFLRDFGITNFEEAGKALIIAVKQSSIFDIDSGIITYGKSEEKETLIQRITFNITAFGLIPEITKYAIAMRRLGSLNYTVGAVIGILFHKPMKAELVIDGEKNDCVCNLISVNNSRFTGGSMEIAPPVRVNDGKLFFLCSRLKKRKLFGLFPSIFKGTHIHDKNIETRLITSLQINAEKPLWMNVDGELEEGINPNITVKPSFFKLYIPFETKI